MTTRLLGAGALLAASLSITTLATSPVVAVELCYGLPVTIIAVAGVATSGTDGPDVILGTTGDDTIKGNGGHDVICGGDGNDRVNGNSGNDTLFGENGSDYLAGDAGSDAIYGDVPSAVLLDNLSNVYTCGQYVFGDDTLLGGSGDDEELRDLCGNNLADGGQGSDELVEASGTARGGSGDDITINAQDGFYFCEVASCISARAEGGSGSDFQVLVVGGTADGGSGRDRVYAIKSGDVANGGSSADQLAGQPGAAVTLNGGSGNDVCFENGGDDVLVSCESVL